MRRYFRHFSDWLVLISMLFVFASCSGTMVPKSTRSDSSPDPNARCSSKSASFSIPYHSDTGFSANHLSLDIYGFKVPTYGCKTAPVVVYVHGGSWVNGDKLNIGDKNNFFNDLGYVFVSVNYRLSPFPPDRPTGVQHPVHEQDVARAVRWVYDNISQYGGDPTTIALMGHSSGAHLVSLLAVHPTYLTDVGLTRSQIRCHVSLDTEAYDIPTAHATGDASQQATLDNAFGTDPAVRTEASPLTHVQAGAGIGPVFLVSRGSADRKANVESFRSALDTAAIPTTVVDASALSHEQVNEVIGSSSDATITPPLVSFLEGCLN